MGQRGTASSIIWFTDASHPRGTWVLSTTTRGALRGHREKLVELFRREWPIRSHVDHEDITQPIIGGQSAHYVDGGGELAAHLSVHQRLGTEP